MEKGNPFFRAIAPEFIPSVDDLEELDALEEVIFIGYPYGIWDTKNLLPIVRKGITATSIGLDFQGENQFLIDASVFPGSSGSPVFIYDKGFYTKKDGYTIPKNRLLFVGILSRVFYKKNKDDIEIISEPTIDTQESISKEFLDLGRVFNPLAINEVIESWLSEREEYANRFNEAVQTKKVI